MTLFPTVSVTVEDLDLSAALSTALAHRGSTVLADGTGDVLVASAATDGSRGSSDTDGTDLFARVERSLLEPADGLVVTGRSTGRSVALPLAPTDSPAAQRSVDELVHNAVCHVAARPEGVRERVTTHPLVQLPAWSDLKAAVSGLRELQATDGSVPDTADQARAAAHVGEVVSGIRQLAPHLPHDADYLEALTKDFGRWADGGFEVPDFYDSILAFAPASHRVDGLPHLVVFPMYTQNGNPHRNVEAVLLQVIWPDFIAELEAGDYSNPLFLPIRFLDFTAGYDSNSAVLFPETVAMREVPAFTWGGIFADREAARFR
ncbi:MAG: hypothetical protein JWP82_916, partial [Humibacillus sp.]|nr:hypothetical protein [Humibacillus sp.]